MGVVLGMTANFVMAETEVVTAAFSKLPGYLEFPGTPDGHGGARPSNFDWNQLTQTTNILPPNALVADYFAARGAPIQSVRWWGAYLGGSVPGSEDGYVISFFGSDDSFRPGRLLGTYVAPIASVRASATDFHNSTGDRIHQYEVELRDTYLIAAVTNRASTEAFRPLPEFTYWMAISAEVGLLVVAQTNQSGTITNWTRESTSQYRTNDFWGWQSHPGALASPAQSAHMRIQGTNGPVPIPDWQSLPPIQGEFSQAFEVLSVCGTNPPRVMSVRARYEALSIDVEFDRPMNPFAIGDLFNYSVSDQRGTPIFVECATAQDGGMRASLVVPDARCGETYSLALAPENMTDRCGVILDSPPSFNVTFPCPDLLSVPCAPQQIVSVLNPCALVLSWNGTNYCLETSTALGLTANWVRLSNTAPTIVYPEQQQRFFRLVCPCP